VKRREKFFGNFLVLLVAIFSLGGNLLLAGTLPEIREDHSPSEETIKAAHTYLWAIRENATPEFSDPSENHFYGSIFTREYFSQREIEKVPSNTYSSYQRDIRNYLSRLTFPTHFFL